MDDGDGTEAQLVSDGRAVLTYRPGHQERPTAEDATPLASLDLVVPAVLDQLSGWWISSPDGDLLDALLGAGATMARHAHLYSLALGGEALPPTTPTPPDRFAITPIDRSPAELVAVVMRAYPAGHVDHQGDDQALEEAELDGLLAGQLVGPYLAEASCLIVDRGAGPDTRAPGVARPVVAGAIVNRSPGQPPDGGPWLSQIFREPGPAHAGLGTLALRWTLAQLAARGEPALGLAVTDGNPARTVYERLGFDHIASRRKLAIP